MSVAIPCQSLSSQRAARRAEEAAGLNRGRRLLEDLGLVTLPLRPRGKRPLQRGWQRGESRWETAPTLANVGVLCGAEHGKGLVIADFDTADGLTAFLGFTPEELADLTGVVRTRRGFHVYALASGPVARRRTVEGVDLLGEGSQAVAPPSIHPTGHIYEWVKPPVRLARAEDVLPGEWLAPLGKTTSRAVERTRDELAIVPSEDVDLEHAAEWVSFQAPKMRRNWAVLMGLADGGQDFDRSKAEFALAACLWEGMWSADDVAGVLLALPRGKARERALLGSEERGVRYAARLVAAAFNTKEAQQRAKGAGLGPSLRVP